MKLLAALTFLLPAVHVAARIEYFGLRTGTQPGAQVVVKSPEYPDYYVVVESGSGVEPERFHWGDENRIVDLDGNAVLVDDRDNQYLHVSLIENATPGFTFDELDQLVKEDDQGEMWFLCPIGGDANGRRLLRLSAYQDMNNCPQTSVYQIPL